MTTSFKLNDFLAEHPFIETSEITAIIEALNEHSIVIMAGPTGAGKSWTASGIARMVHQGEQRHSMIAMHQGVNFSNFVLGITATSTGLFAQEVDVAKQSPDQTHVVVIEDVNRGDLPSAAGPLWPLLHSSKRGHENAVNVEPVGNMWLPHNLKIIATLCTANQPPPCPEPELDRSFPRFNFEPRFNNAWLQYCIKVGIPEQLAREARSRIQQVNSDIAEAPTLGPEYRITHSYLTPSRPPEEPATWMEYSLQQASYAAEFRWDGQPQMQRKVREILTAPLGER